MTAKRAPFHITAGMMDFPLFYSAIVANMLTHYSAFQSKNPSYELSGRLVRLAKEPLPGGNFTNRLENPQKGFLHLAYVTITGWQSRR
jgi:hypothetical protein